MRPTKKLQAEAKKWIEANGACDIKIKEEEIDLYNGGLFQDMDENRANLWIGDLDSTINYLTRLKRQLNKMGFDTRRGI